MEAEIQAVVDTHIGEAEQKNTLRPVFEPILDFIVEHRETCESLFCNNEASGFFERLEAMCRGEQETVISHRVVSSDVVRESIVIIVAVFLFVDLVYVLVSPIEKTSVQVNFRLYFEAISAITTTGLSIGNTTSELSKVGRIVVMAAMLVGRLGALTIVMMIGARESKRHVRYPSEELVVG